jgi:hypothetical protein
VGPDVNKFILKFGTHAHETSPVNR